MTAKPKAKKGKKKQTPSGNGRVSPQAAAEVQPDAPSLLDLTQVQALIQADKARRAHEAYIGCQEVLKRTRCEMRPELHMIGSQIQHVINFRALD